MSGVAAARILGWDLFQVLPEQASETASKVDRPFYIILTLSIVIFVTLMAIMFFFVIKYRRKSPDQRTSPSMGNLKLEVGWTVATALGVLFIFSLGFKGWMGISVPPEGSIEVRVTAFKWGWEFQYPDHGISWGHLKVPLGRPVKLVMSSKDVVHSFFVPAFRIKRDVLPERYTVLWFKATKLGNYDIRCAEYCGTRHSKMITQLQVVPYREWKKWYDSGGGLDKLSPIKYGEHLFRTKCTACHSADESREVIVGPPMYGIFGKKEVLSTGKTVTVDENYLRRSIVMPQADVVKGFENKVMNPFPELKDKQINALIDYIKSLRKSK